MTRKKNNTGNRDVLHPRGADVIPRCRPRMPVFPVAAEVEVAVEVTAVDVVAGGLVTTVVTKTRTLPGHPLHQKKTIVDVVESPIETTIARDIVVNDRTRIAENVSVVVDPTAEVVAAVEVTMILVK